MRAIGYIRVSTEMQAEGGVSLDAQRSSISQYCQLYELDLVDIEADEGLSGKTLDRPALERAFQRMEDGEAEMLVIVKLDRLTRSVHDLGILLERYFSEGKFNLTSVNERIDTTSASGRLTLNILLSFAQFEREIIGERIRDKVAAQKRKGKWTGGVPVLGYDVDRSGPSPRLVVNDREARRTRAIFKLYLELGSLLPVVKELRHREWKSKKRTTTKGTAVGGRPFDKATLYALLRNPIVTGKITHKGEVYDGEHEAIVDQNLFDEVQALLSLNGRTGGPETRNKYGAILRGLLRCRGCDKSMTHRTHRPCCGG